ncbi:MAG TPA: enoyl-CoA hydratase-related protein [Acidimicrobiales bacterium]|nr:enoyl-CoA hydratase-related protein [Acidimicrobiales bacterium]
MQLSQVRYEVEAPVAHLVLDRPRYRNAQSRVLREEMDEAFAAAITDPTVRVVVLSGEGDHFSSGHDLGTPEELEDQAARPFPPGFDGRFSRSWELNVENSLRWRDLPKPTIAAVQGWCIYGGWIIASAMDLIVAADDARFVPGLVQYFTLPWDLSPRKAKEVLFQSRVVTAAEAERLGMVNQVVPRDQLLEETMALARRIAETDPFVVRMVKLAVNNTQDVAGFRASVTANHSAYMLAQAAGAVRPPADEASGRRRLPGVDLAIRADAEESAGSE